MRSVSPLFIVLTALTVCSTGNTALIDLRIATFNIAMGLQEEGRLGQNLASGHDLNEDTHDADATAGAIGQLLAFPLINASCTPLSSGGREASVIQGGKNRLDITL